MSRDLSTTGDEGLRKRLDEAVVLHATVMQLRKDLDTEEIAVPTVGVEAFELIRGQVLQVMEMRQRTSPHALGRIINRVDLTEKQSQQALAQDGLGGLATAAVLRCLQKVLVRMSFNNAR